MQNLAQIEWKDLIDNDNQGVIIDTRTYREWREGSIENSILLDVLNPYSFMNEAQKLEKNKNYYIYCRTGVRSIQACMILENIGITNTFNLNGGLVTWSGKVVYPEM